MYRYYFIETLIATPYYRVYASQEDCYARRATKMLYMSYSSTGFLTEDGVPLYRCKTTSSRSSYVYVCYGSTGIQKLKYSEAKCKGAGTVVLKSSFDEYCSGAKLTTLPTCVGPPAY